MNRTSIARPSLRRFAHFAILAAALPLVAGCSVASPDDSEELDKNGDALNPRYGVDYSWARPSLPHLKSEGYTFAARYLSYDNTGKNLSLGEANALEAEGIDVVANWEAGSQDSLDGYNKGVTEAQAAEAQAKADGMPAGRPIYFSVDFDASDAEQGTIDAYFDGVASIIGKDRTGAYAGYYVIKRLFDQGKIAWGWQTYAWSGGQWDPRAQLRQTHNDIEPGCDKDESHADDFGQWKASGGGNGSGSSGGGGNPPPASPTCGVEGDGRLHCDNKPDVAMYAATNAESAVVNHLKSTNSWFDCWSTGELHAGGNHTWYHTLGDDNGNYGYVPAVDLKTADSFDADPSAHGLKSCEPPKAALPANCDVHADGKLYCVNSSHSAMYKATNTGSGVVNHLETTSSWFKCWGTGALHAGGNHTWYYTEGDDNGNWGWVPAVDLKTPDAFDADPSGYGFAQCK